MALGVALESEGLRGEVCVRGFRGLERFVKGVRGRWGDVCAWAGEEGGKSVSAEREGLGSGMFGVGTCTRMICSGSGSGGCGADGSRTGEEGGAGEDSCRKGSPFRREMRFEALGDWFQDRPTERGRLAERRLRLSVSSSRGELRMRRNSVAASAWRLMGDW